MQVRCYEDLLAWKSSMKLARDIYRFTRNFPADETYGIRSQMRRAVVSVPSNIAEGHARLTTGEYKHFLGIARGSLAELSTQVRLSMDLGYLTAPVGAELLAQIGEAGRLTNGLLRALERKVSLGREPLPPIP